MLLSRYLVPFTYYNLILIILFSLSVSSIESFSIINLISYALLHFTIIYLGLYYYRRSLYSIYFLYGLGFDILLINQIGPHLFIFMTLLFFLVRIIHYCKLSILEKIKKTGYEEIIEIKINFKYLSKLKS